MRDRARLGRLLALLAVGLAASCSVGGGGGTATVLLSGPRFYTGDPGRPWAAALLVRDGRVVELYDEVPEGVPAQQVRLPGAVAVPGLVDAHAHLLGYGLARRRADLVGLPTLGATLDAITSYAAAHPDDRWLLGRGWDQNDWPERRWPTAAELERAVPGRPAAMWRIDGHALWVNETALAEAGIGADTQEVPGGRIVRDARGRPTGVLIDAATELVTRVMPPPDATVIEQALETAGRELAALGLTGMHDMGMSEAVFAALTRLQQQGRFRLRIVAYASADDPLAERVRHEGRLTSGRVTVAGVKFYADGALGSRGARLLAPYRDAPDSTGLWVTPPEELRRQIRETLAAGLQPAVHAIGDAANRAVLDAYEEAFAEDGGRRRLRPRIEHVQVLDPADIPRAAGEGLVVSMQPTHATSDMPWAGERLGPERLRGAYAWRSLLDAGARLAFGSDAPVESPDPRLGLYAAVTRQDLSGNPPGGFLPEQRLTLEEALAAFGSGAAYAAGLEQELGRIAPGYRCDLTVFDGDIFTLSPREWPSLPVAAVVVGGERIDEGSRPAGGE